MTAETLTHNPDTLSPEHVRAMGSTVVEASAYISDPEAMEDSTFGAEKVAAYNEKFFDPVHKLLTASQDVRDAAHLGTGNEGEVYAFDIGEDRYAVKTGGISADHIRAFRRGAHVKHAAHLAGINAENTLIVMDRVPGEVAYRLSYEERLKQPKEDLEQLINTVLELHTDLEVDANPGNFLYDKQEGWGVVDYKVQADLTKSRARLVLSLADMLTRYAPWDTPEPPHRTEDKARSKYEDVTILNHYLDVLEESYPDILAEAAEEQAAVRDNPHKYAVSMLYNLTSLTDDSPLNTEFRARVKRLGLVGNEFDPAPSSSYDEDMVFD